MKILTPDQNTIQIRNSGVGSIMGGGVLAVAGIVAGIIFLQSMLIGAAIAGIFAIIGIVIVFTAKSTVTTLLRQGTSTVEAKRLIGGKTTSSSFDSSRVTAVRLQSEYHRNNPTGPNRAAPGTITIGGNNTGNNQGTTITSRLVILLNDGIEVLVASASKSANSGLSIGGANLSSIYPAKLKKLADQVAAFYGLPLATDTPLGAGGITEAIHEVSQAIHQPQPLQPTPQQPSIPPSAPQPVQPAVPEATGSNQTPPTPPLQ